MDDHQTNAMASMSLSDSTFRTANAISTAPGESPCTHTDSASMPIVEPSIASMVPSRTSRSTRSATVDGSDSTAPAHRLVVLC
ncbi:hypothetical protein A2J03_26960 [Rhodococcus sp. EPR-157]|nr:hypothetical protein A2J03_26960 [Rhodococcus sp. EPR-157]